MQNNIYHIDRNITMSAVSRIGKIKNMINQDAHLSVLIVGGGVNGIGVFRDLALQGVDVLLVEQSDYCSGTSAASSHMAHGGLRYLENGEFRLVKEAVAERNWLLEKAPHYVKPLPTAIPIFKIFSGVLNAPLKFLGLMGKPYPRGALIIKAGLLLYDLFAKNNVHLPKHVLQSKDMAKKYFPKISPQLKLMAIYYDGAISSPERLCLEMVRDGEEVSHRAIAVNYVKVVRIEKNFVILEDQVTKERMKVKPKVMVNAAGPWIDEVNLALGSKSEFVGGTKGSHIILDHPELRSAIGDHEIFFENGDGRIVLIFPYFDKVLIGTTDLPVNDMKNVVCTDEEIAYFIDMIKVVFPSIEINQSQIVFQYSGVRPLASTNEMQAGQISRDHVVRTLAVDADRDFPILSIVGGKWTTFRAFAQEVTDLILSDLDMPRKKSSLEVAIGGGKDYPRNFVAAQSWIEQKGSINNVAIDRVKTLLGRYGTYAERILNYISGKRENFISGLGEYSEEEIEFLVSRENVVRLDDVVLRRMNVAKLGQVNIKNLSKLAEVTAQALGWSEKERILEVARMKEIFRIRHGVNLGEQ